MNNEVKVNSIDVEGEIKNERGGVHSSKIDNVLYKDFENRINNRKDKRDESIDDFIKQAVLDYQNGNEEVFDSIYNYYKPMLERLSVRKNDQEILPELSIVLWNAVRTFNVEGGAKFNTYFWECARNHIGTLNIRKMAKKRTAENGVVSMNNKVRESNNGETSNEYGEFIEDSRSSKSFDQALFNTFLEENIFPHLKEGEIDAIKLLLAGYTFKEIGKQLGNITAPAVHVKLRRLANKQNVGVQLRSFYEMNY